MSSRRDRRPTATAAPDAAPPPRRRRALLCALIALLAVAVHANTLTHGLVYDDKQILLSPLLHDPWNLKEFWRNGFYPKNGLVFAIYRPLSNLLLVVNHRVDEILTGSGENPIGFHAVGVLMHATVACLLFAWLEQLRFATRIALSAALLFAVLPIHTEVVANISNRSESQAAIFGLAFLILHRRGAWLLAASAYLLALWSKESAIAFLPVAGIADLAAPPAQPSRAGEPRQIRWSRYVAPAVVGAYWLTLRAEVLRDVQEAPTFLENPLYFVSPLERILTACKVQLEYLRLQAAPLELSTDYSFRRIPVVSSPADPGFLAFVAVLAGVSILAWRLRKREPVVAFAVAGYAICFSTTSNFLVSIGTLMGERLAYAPSLFFAVFLAWMLWKAERWIGARAVAAGIAVLLVAYSAKSVLQNRVWKDELTLGAEQVRTAPDSAKSHLNYGSALDDSASTVERQAAAAGRQGGTAESSRLQAAALDRRRSALSQYERSREIYGSYATTHFLIGNSLRALKADPEKILAAYREAIRIDPWLVDARVNLASMLVELRRFEEARPIVQEIAINDPQNPSLAALQRSLAAQPPPKR